MDMVPSGLDTTLNSKTSLKNLFSNTYLSIDKFHPVIFDLHFRDGHQVLLAIRYIKEILGFLAFEEESTISLITCITNHSFDHWRCPRNDCYLHQEMCLCHSDTPSHNGWTYFNKASAFPSTFRSELPNEVIFRWVIKNFRYAIRIAFFASTSP